MEARDQFRIPLFAGLSCHPGADACVGPTVPIPLWHITMRGTDERGQAVSTVIDLSLPADPPLSPQTTAKSVRPVTLVPPER